MAEFTQFDYAEIKMFVYQAEILTEDSQNLLST